MHVKLIYSKKIVLFFFTEYENEWKGHKFRRRKNKKSDFCNNKKIFHIDDIDVIKYQFLKKNHMTQIMHLNTLFDIMIMMLLDHYV